MEDLKFQILLMLHRADFSTAITKHYTTIDRLIDGSDNMAYERVKVIAKRRYLQIEDSEGNEIYADDIVCSSDGTKYIAKLPMHCEPVFHLIKGQNKEGLITKTHNANHTCRQVKVIGNKFENPELLEK